MEGAVGERQSGSSALLAASASGALLLQDERFCDLTGMPRAVLATGSLRAVIEWLRESNDDVGCAIAHVLDGRTQDATTGQIRSDSGRVIEWVASALVEGQAPGRVWTFHDASRYHAALQALRDAESWLRMFTAHRDGVVLEVDENRRVAGLWATDANAFFGVPEAGLLGRTVTEALPTDTPDLDGRLLHVLSTEQPTSFELEVTLAGERRVVTVNAALMPREAGDAPRMTLLIRDVTVQARLKSQLQQTERLVSVGLLAAGVAHEINNPLGYLLLNLERVRTRFEELGSVTEVQAGMLTEMGRSIDLALEGARSVQAIVRDLTQVGAKDEGPRVPVDVRHVLRATLDLAAPELEPRARVVRDFGPVPPIVANEGRLGQVFLNLVLNAAQAIPEGDPSGNEIRVVTKTDGRGRATIEFHDTGVGIPPHAVRHIFDPFFTTKAPGTGTGLGLAICHGITTSFGGFIAVESKNDRGSIFRVVLPATTGEESPTG